MKVIFGIIGAVLLIGLFFVVYQVVLSIQPPQANLAGFTNQPTSIGQTGGFHLLNDVKVLTRDKYDSVALYTRLNRNSVIEDIVTPFAEVTPSGDIGIRVKLSDTAVMTGLPKVDYERISHQVISNSVIQDVALANPRSLDTQELIITLSKSSRYRISADPQDAGIIYLDVLK